MVHGGIANHNSSARRSGGCRLRWFLRNSTDHGPNFKQHRVLEGVEIAAIDLARSSDCNMREDLLCNKLWYLCQLLCIAICKNKNSKQASEKTAYQLLRSVFCVLPLKCKQVQYVVEDQSLACQNPGGDWVLHDEEEQMRCFDSYREASLLFTGFQKALEGRTSRPNCFGTKHLRTTRGCCDMF